MTTTYSYAKAKQSFDLVLKKASREGEVKIRKDNQLFVLTPQFNNISPLDIEGVDTDINSKEIIRFIHEGRKT